MLANAYKNPKNAETWNLLRVDVSNKKTNEYLIHSVSSANENQYLCLDQRDVEYYTLDSVF